MCAMSDSVVLGQPVHQPSAEFQYPKTVLSAPEHPSSTALIEIWRAHEATGGMRMGRDIPTRALGKLLPNIVIAEPQPDWSDARIRLAGSVLTERFGRDITGAQLSEIYRADPDGGAMLLACARRADETREPGLLGTRVLAGSLEVMRFEVVGLPIYAPDGVVHWTLVGTFRF